ncbi:1-acyl-sn-glycerol-3-phosphate acyltransferase [Leptospira perolatii]|uniref:1-acyl-sn-glycerol-3-phosphate acyltransferase n=1 Tax=Leptospira perolatii TaxID=2023191 RepID=A0A2M9ZQI6_9LEPT|nr:lysophospholipid acyltransferase family protein [Leptospira perolatii]PJZ70511.1 1-acyl-sn-glycerol-3-phosphate acyltransferase [Leptospira perolatii]PJZ74348.1 1-acyl-sn-glycerol-3-phosphate acyltransferase [Leptospira perolatii]
MHSKNLNREELGVKIHWEPGTSLSYTTPANRKRWLFDRLLLGSDLPFILGYFSEIVKSRKLSLDGKYDDPTWTVSSGVIFDLVEKCGGKFQVENMENLISPQGPVVFAGNHMSVLETFVLPHFIVPFRPVTFVVKESLVKGKLFGPVMRSRNPIAVGRTNPREDLVKVLEEGTKILKGGTSIVVFPQSTRTTTFAPSEFNSIAVKLASRAGVPVVPMALRTDFWENGKIFKDIASLHRKNEIHMKFGTPLPPEMDARKKQETLLEFVLANLKAWKVPILDQPKIE